MRREGTRRPRGAGARWRRRSSRRRPRLTSTLERTAAIEDAPVASSLRLARDASRHSHPRQPRRGPPVLRRDPPPRRVEPNLPVVPPEHGDRPLIPGRDPLSPAHRRGDGVDRFPRHVDPLASTQSVTAQHQPEVGAMSARPLVTAAVDRVRLYRHSPWRAERSQAQPRQAFLQVGPRSPRTFAARPWGASLRQPDLNPPVARGGCGFCLDSARVAHRCVRSLAYLQRAKQLITQGPLVHGGTVPAGWRARRITPPACARGRCPGRGDRQGPGPPVHRGLHIPPGSPLSERRNHTRRGTARDDGPRAAGIPAAQAPSELDQNPKKRSGGQVTFSMPISVKVPGPPKKPGCRIRPMPSRVDAFRLNTTE